jgi:hypothetical protein
MAWAFPGVRFQRLSGTWRARIFRAMGAPIGPVPMRATEPRKPGVFVSLMIGVVMRLRRG